MSSGLFSTLFSHLSAPTSVSSIFPEKVVTFEKIDGPIIHMKFKGAFTEASFQRFMDEYETYFDTDYKFVLLFDLRNVSSEGFQMSWMLSFVAKLMALRQKTATHVMGTAVFLSKEREEIVSILKTFFQLYNTVRPHFASTNEDELMDFVEKVLFEN